MGTTTPRILPSRGRATQPWRNGGGITSQIAISPATATLENFDWRMSLTTVDGESDFSLYPGVNRWLMPLAIDGMALRIEGETTYLAGREAFAFGGEASVHAINVAHSALYLNLMVRRGSARGSLLALVTHDETAIAAAHNESVIVVVLEDSPSVGATELAELDAIELEPGTDIVLSGQAVIAIARITRN